MTEGVFGDNQTNTLTNNDVNGSVNNQTTAESKPADKVFTYVEGEKVKTFTGADEIYNGYVHSQQYIETLKKQNADLETRLKTLESSNEELETYKNSAKEILEAVKSNSNKGSSDMSSQALDQNTLVTTVTEIVEKRAQEEKLRDNLQKATSALTTVYGDKAGEHVTKIAGENGLTVKQAEEMAKYNPILFNRLFLPKTDASSTRGPSVNTSTVNSKSLTSSPEFAPESRSFSDMSSTEAGVELKRRREELRKKYTTGI